MATRTIDPRIPNKKFFRIGEAAKIADVEPYVLRYWETEFRSLRPGKTGSNRRQYSQQDVEIVLRIRDLLYRDGYTIAGARKRLDEPQSDQLSNDQTGAALERIRKEAEELLQLVQD